MVSRACEKVLFVVGMMDMLLVLRTAFRRRRTRITRMTFGVPFLPCDAEACGWLSHLA